MKKCLDAGAKVANITFTRTDWNKSLLAFHLESQGKSVNIL